MNEPTNKQQQAVDKWVTVISCRTKWQAANLLISKTTVA